MCVGLEVGNIVGAGVGADVGICVGAAVVGSGVGAGGVGAGVVGAGVGAGGVGAGVDGMRQISHPLSVFVASEDHEMAVLGETSTPCGPSSAAPHPQHMSAALKSESS